METATRGQIVRLPVGKRGRKCRAEVLDIDPVTGKGIAMITRQGLNGLPVRLIVPLDIRSIQAPQAFA